MGTVRRPGTAGPDIARIRHTEDRFLARHRSPSGASATLSDLTALAKPVVGNRSKHRPASPSSRRAHRHPLAAAAAALVAAAIFAGSQPMSMPASAQASLPASGSASPLSDRSADAAASRDERTAIDSVLAGPPAIPGAGETSVPDLNSSGSANGSTGTAALTGNPCPTEGFGGVKPHVAQAGWHLIIVFGLSESDVGGVSTRPGNPTSDHPRGYALDFMVDTSTGNGLAAYAEDHTEELGIKYILWQVPDHYDHVHISFNDEPGSGMTC